MRARQGRGRVRGGRLTFEWPDREVGEEAKDEGLVSIAVPVRKIFLEEV